MIEARQGSTHGCAGTRGRDTPAVSPRASTSVSGHLQSAQDAGAGAMVVPAAMPHVSGTPAQLHHLGGAPGEHAAQVPGGLLGAGPEELNTLAGTGVMGWVDRSMLIGTCLRAIKVSADAAPGGFHRRVFPVARTRGAAQNRHVVLRLEAPR